MSNDGSNPNNGKVPRAGKNKFAAVFAPRGKGGAGTAPTAPASARVVHEKQSNLPNTLVADLIPAVAPVAPLRAGGGDDDLMSQPPAKNAPKAKPPRTKSDGRRP